MRHKSEVLPFRHQLSPKRQQFFKRVFERHHAALCKFILRLGVSEQNCSDIAQDVYLRIVRQDDPDKLKQAPRSYLYAIATNLVRDQIRREQRRHYDRHSSSEEQELVSPQAPPDEQSDMRRRLDLLREAILDLPLHRQRVFLLNRFYHLSTRQIAEKLNIPRRTVQRYLNDATVQCQKKVELE